jgi:hypothetical protein
MTIHKFKWYWAWQDEKEEAWLRKMSQQGYHLVSVKPFGRYSFKFGDKMDYAYRLYYLTNQKDRSNCLQRFQDAGWERIGEGTDWQYYRKPVENGESPEIYTDVESKLTKYKMAIAHFGIMDIIMITVVGHHIMQHYPYDWWYIVRIVFGFVVLLLTYIIARLAIRI